MSAPIKTKEELTRLAWITELRRQGHRQCYDRWQKNMRVCALGLLAEIAGVADADDVGEIGALAGLGQNDAYKVVSLNDGRHTFAEIADVVDGWFKS